MKIKARLYATLNKYHPGESSRHEWIETCQAGSTVKDFLLQVNIPLDEAKLIFINGVSGSLETVLQNDDEQGVFPSIGGG